MNCLDSLQDGEKIKRNMEKVRKETKFKNEAELLLKEKCDHIADYTEITFEASSYSRIRSKFYTLLQDKYLLYQAYKLGPKNYEEIKQKMLGEKIFMFDYYLKSIKSSLLGKRIHTLI